MAADETFKQHLDVCLFASWPVSLQWWRSSSLLLCIRASREESSRLTRLSPVHVRIFYYHLHSSHSCLRSMQLIVSAAFNLGLNESILHRFNPKEDISNQNVLRSSVQRGIRTAIMTQYPVLAADDGLLMEAIWPKKGDGELVKWSVFISGVAGVECLMSDLSSRDHISIYALEGEPLFFQQKNGLFFPTLKLLHKCWSFAEPRLGDPPVPNRFALSSGP